MMVGLRVVGRTVRLFPAEMAVLVSDRGDRGAPRIMSIFDLQRQEAQLSGARDGHKTIKRLNKSIEMYLSLSSLH